MAQNLVGKAAVVTGAGRGIGRGIALALAAEGAGVIVNDLFREPDGTLVADKVVGEIKAAGGNAVPNYDSVTTMATGQRIINTAKDKFGRIDILVNCAGNFVVVPLVDTTEETWDSVMNVHVKGHFSCTKAAVAEMIKQRSGTIINFSSRGAFFSPAGCTAYGAAKAAIMGFSATLAKEVQEYGITVNCIFPSAITQLFPSKVRKTGGDNMPAALTLDPDYVAPMVVYLATDAARDITGRFIYAGGGDIVIYAQPLQIAAPATRMVRKVGKWTVEELGQVIHPLLGLS